MAADAVICMVSILAFLTAFTLALLRRKLRIPGLPIRPDTYSLNVFIGVLNMVPLPPLDGGHVAVAVYERIRSRHGRRYHADASKLVPVAAATLAVLLVLGGALIWLDIFRPVTLQ